MTKMSCAVDALSIAFVDDEAPETAPIMCPSALEAVFAQKNKK